jgi:hypothetical protein
MSGYYTIITWVEKTEIMKDVPDSFMCWNTTNLLSKNEIKR